MSKKAMKKNKKKKKISCKDCSALALPLEVRQMMCRNCPGNKTQLNKLRNGKYRTDNGSTLEISGKYGGISKISFDWLEEGGCVDCQCEAYPEEFDSDDWRLIWHCDYCGGGSAKLQLID